MTDEDFERIQRVQQQLVEQFVNLIGVVNNLRASVNVLKLYVATQIQPDDPQVALKGLQEIEERLLATSPDEQARLQNVELIQSLKDWKKRGGGSHEA